MFFAITRIQHLICRMFKGLVTSSCMGRVDNRIQSITVYPCSSKIEVHQFTKIVWICTLVAHAEHIALLQLFQYFAAILVIMIMLNNATPYLQGLLKHMYVC